MAGDSRRRATERALVGLAAAPGSAVGPTWVWSDAGSDEPIGPEEGARTVGPDESLASSGPAAGARATSAVGSSRSLGTALDLRPPAGGRAEVEGALAALARVAAELGAEAARLRAEGRPAEAEILEASQLIADDPGLRDDVAASAPAAGAARAIAAAVERHALALASLPDPDLAARAADVRAVGRRAQRALSTEQRGRGAEHRPVDGDTGAGNAGRHESDGDAGSGAHPLDDSVEAESVALAALRGAEAGDAGRDRADRDASSAEGAPPSPSAPARPPSVLVARDLGPADVAGLGLGSGAVLAIALVEGAATSHAAIVARSYGLPMVVGLGPALLDLRDGEPILVDGDAGEVVVDAAPDRRRAAEAAMAAARTARAPTARRGPLRARDGRSLRLLCNAARADEVVAGLAAGAEGLGLLRTELAFLGATAWPSEDEHLAALAPLLGPLAGRLATVRTLDFGADKTPPFLRGVADRGVALTLRHPAALSAQLRAIARAGAATRLRVKLPLVEDEGQVRAGRRLLDEAVAAVGWATAARPLLGAAVETPAAVERIDAIAAASDFLSIGTNDLAAYALGHDRGRPVAGVRAAGDPRVLALIARIVAAAHARGLSVEVCGEAAGDPELAVRLVEAGVDELSMAPPRLAAVRAAIERDQGGGRAG